MARTPDHLLEKYGRQGPRYTSYPAVPHWNHDVGARDVAFALRELGARPQEPSDAEIYVHIPFCARLCTFCGCHTFITRKQEPVEVFLEAIGREAAAIEAHAGRRLKIGGLHLGGGTPTHLNVEQLGRLLDSLERHFDFSPCLEKSLEVHPHVTTFEQIDFLASRRFDRLSLGVQDLTPEVQEAIHRFQTHEETARLVAHARTRGFKSINVDLIYGLPKQTLEGFGRTLQQVADMKVDRLAVYGYAHVPWLKKNQRAIEEPALPDPKLRRDLYELAIARLEGAGFRSIGFDHYARPDDELFRAQYAGTLTRTFMGFTVQHAPVLLGIGPSAIGEIGPLYAQNENELKPWSEGVARDGLAVKRGFQLSGEDTLRRELIRAILCHLRFDLPKLAQRRGIDFKAHFARELDKLREMQADGLLVLEREGGFTLTENGRLLARNVAMAFDQYLEPAGKAGEEIATRAADGAPLTPSTPIQPRYSTTI